MANNWLRQHPKLHMFYLQNRFRTITSRMRGLPDFVIIGAQKSGTTSLYNFIIKHPTIAPASQRELHYFSGQYRFGEQWYRSNFPTNLSRRYFYKKTKQKLLSGEASPTYMFHPIASDRMKNILPDIKLIAILRNPVDRAYSQYHHNIRRNNETLPFEKAIELEEERCAVEKERLIRDSDFVATHYIKHSYLELCFPIISSIDTSLRFCLCHCFFSCLAVFGGGFPSGYTILGVPYPLLIAVSII